MATIVIDEARPIGRESRDPIRAWLEGQRLLFTVTFHPNELLYGSGGACWDVNQRARRTQHVVGARS